MMTSGICQKIRPSSFPVLKRGIQQLSITRRLYSTTSQTNTETDTADREFLASIKPKSGRVDLTKDADTGIATVTLDDPQVHNGFCDPLKSEDYFNLKSLFNMRQLFDARVHIGHKVGVRNPYMIPYLFGTRLGCDILNLDETVEHLHKALNVAAHVAYRNGIIMFITRHYQSLLLVEGTAKECEEYSHCRYWRGGTFTNAPIMFNATVRLPDLCIFLNTHNTIFEQHLAVVEATKMNIPTVGIVDSSSDPRLITYPIPGNDDTICAIELYCSLFKKAILSAKERRLKDQQHLTLQS